MFEGIKQREKEGEGERESVLPPRCQSLEQCSMGNFIHEVKKKGAGTDSTQLFSIKPFNCSVRGQAVLLHNVDRTLSLTGEQWKRAEFTSLFFIVKREPHLLRKSQTF